ncbi:MAG: hypothetical protein IMF10_07070 [Proteobacteria bacterium]|nr:hypothetical protein [Pseudomonadota bacterium]
MKNIPSQKTRAGVSKILGCIGVLIWVSLGIYIIPRRQLQSPAEWGIFIAGGIFLIIAAMLSRKRTKKDRQAQQRTGRSR